MTTHTTDTTDTADTTQQTPQPDGAAGTGSTTSTNTALIVIDVQESFRQREGWQAVSNPAVADRVAVLVEHARAQGHLVVWVLHAEPGSGGVFDPVNGHNRYIPPLTPADGEPQLVKTSHNAFTTTNLQQILTERGIRSVITCGIRTEQCVETTPRLASDLGYDVTFVEDATATEPIGRPGAPAGRPLTEILADPRTMLPAEIIARTRYALAGRFATVTTVGELIGS